MKDCDEHPSNLYAMYSAADSNSLTCRFIHMQDSKVGVVLNLQQQHVRDL